MQKVERHVLPRGKQSLNEFDYPADPISELGYKFPVGLKILQAIRGKVGIVKLDVR